MLGQFRVWAFILFNGQENMYIVAKGMNEHPNAWHTILQMCLQNASLSVFFYACKILKASALPKQIITNKCE